MMGPAKLQMPLMGIKGISPSFLKRLQKLGLQTVKDLLWHFPARYEDFSQIYKIADLTPGQQATIQAVVQEVGVKHTWRRHLAIVEALVADESGSLRIVWFNQPYIAQTLKPGKTANFAGRVSLSDEGEIYLSHPAYEVVGHQISEIGSQKSDIRYPISETRHTARLVPVYPETKGLTSKGLRYLIQPLLRNLETLAEWLPQTILQKYKLPELNDALKKIHFPEQLEDALAARKRFAFENLFLLQLFNFKQKMRLAQERAPVIKTDLESVKKFLKELPFELTLSQKKSLWEIIKDLEKPRPMNRLLQGDVGSGKTVVAALASFLAAEAGYQTAVMAPTEVLARQHFATFKKLAWGTSAFHQSSIGLITSVESKVIWETDLETSEKKLELRKKIKAGEVKIIIGTHALIQKNVAFKNLALIVIDEQHRFGVKQRAELTRRKNMIPHLLSMSATPIPRTLMLTVFGDLDLSLITELPVGRKNIITTVVLPEEYGKTYEFIRAEVKKGRQVFVICPRIESNPKNSSTSKLPEKKNKSFGAFEWSSGHSDYLLEMKAVKEEYAKLKEKIFPDLKVAMLHGQMPAKGRSARLTEATAKRASGGKLSKEQVMDDFRNGKIDILISTSVIEVGVDIPNATIMLIESAERFGLAQLYQFRGRVGRGTEQSYCFLMTSSPEHQKNERLKAILKARNGFDLAEMDLKIRGPGEFLGEEQTGFPDIAMAALQDPELVRESREAAVGIIQTDPALVRYPLLRAKTNAFQKEIHME